MTVTSAGEVRTPESVRAKRRVNRAVTIADTTGHITQPAGGQLNGIDITAHGARHKPNGADSIGTGTFSAEDVLVFDATNVVPKFHAVRDVTATFTVTTTGLADITGLSWSLPRAGTYYFEVTLLMTQATSTSINGVAINLSGTPTRFAQEGILIRTAAAADFRANTTDGTAMVHSVAMAVGGPFAQKISGTVTIPGAQTLTAQAQRATATTTIIAGSGGFVIER